MPLDELQRLLDSPWHEARLCALLVLVYRFQDKKTPEAERENLYELAASDNLWEQRISIVCTWAFIRRSDFTDTLVLAERLMTHKHDLMHKAVGWMLREVGKRDRDTLTDFLERYATQLPRTALRYAIEHYPEDRRQYFLKMK